ncbi:hypothetical protein QAD02_007618 [Eretmocerus hayati]|uniref:Uncharacterized protein n=1 Tax=Eretmocerus hayati TaxID=131215 RepID=A0ACC2N4Y6_9HYME|nr:hypothetical protein QAD02_007618 [Eretmocerus hayati]
MFPWMAIELFHLVEPLLPNHYAGVPPDMQFLSVLSFLAHGSYQKSNANDHKHPISQPTLSKYIHIVISAINSLRHRYIRFPRTEEEIEKIQDEFAERLGIDGVLGALDCTTIKIFTPAEFEEAFVDRKNNHSLNSQMICNMNYKIMALKICRGSTHDQHIWNRCKIRDRMYRFRLQNGRAFYFIADEGYSPSRVLLVPMSDAAPGTPERNYSDAIRGTRCKIEQTFGVLKGSWRCLNGMRGLHYEPHFAAEIITSCVILHNFLREKGMPLPDFYEHQAEADERIPPVMDGEYQLGLQERERIIRTYFQ